MTTWTMLKNYWRLQYKQIIITAVLVIVAALILDQGINRMLGTLVPVIQGHDSRVYFFSVIITFLIITSTLGIACGEIGKHSAGGILTTFRTAGLQVNSLYLNLVLNILSESVLLLVLITVTLMLVSGVYFSFGILLLFWVNLWLCLALFIQLGLILSVFFRPKFIFLSLLIVIIPLFFISGFFYPVGNLTGVGHWLIALLPTAVSIEGSKSITINNTINGFTLVYVVVLNIFIFIGGTYLFRRKLQR